MKTISVVSGTYNEEENVEDLYRQIQAVFADLPGYHYEHIFIDNSSTDKTVEVLRNLARTHPNVKVIVNTRNFGPIRSGYYGMLQARGDAVVAMASDLQDPPALIKDFITEWEKGYKIVLGIKSESEESTLFFALRKIYYRLLRRFADVELNINSTGFGLYDASVMEVLRQIQDPYPYFRGLICEIGFSSAKVYFKQPQRQRGLTKSNFYLLYDIAMLGITEHSKVPLRLATMFGFATSLLSFGLAIIYLLYKLLYWKSFSLGIAPLVIGLFFFASVQLFFIGILGEYIGSIHTKVLKRPLVVEKERINF
jgi:glycosyltransferase involved in cell wall biosynthesis